MKINKYLSRKKKEIGEDPSKRQEFRELAQTARFTCRFAGLPREYAVDYLTQRIKHPLKIYKKSRVYLPPYTDAQKTAITNITRIANSNIDFKLKNTKAIDELV
jgi:hypothetical protein